MDHKAILEAANLFVQEFHQADTTGHDYWHIKRVENMAKKLAEAEGASIFECRLAALLHDLDDYKHGGDEEKLPLATSFLQKHSFDKVFIDKILTIIRQVSFKGGSVQTKPGSPEACCVQDADRLDAIGAIGIARTFAYGGNKNRPIYDPGIKPVCHTTFAAYKTNSSPTINHFYEKLLLLKDKMNTATAGEIAEERHRFMEVFLKQFYQEWDFIDRNI